MSVCFAGFDRQTCTKTGNQVCLSAAARQTDLVALWKPGLSGRTWKHQTDLVSDFAAGLSGADREQTDLVAVETRSVCAQPRDRQTWLPWKPGLSVRSALGQPDLVADPACASSPNL